jgi:hypothetical protein
LTLSHVLHSWQAYIGSFALYPDIEDTASALRNRELTLILMASSADPVVFKELLRGKKYLEKVSYCRAEYSCM